MPRFAQWSCCQICVAQQYKVVAIKSAYRLRGKVVAGFKRGSKLLGFPTANLDPCAFKDVLVDVPRGVYCGFASVNGGPVYQTVLSLGTNPTFETKEETVVRMLY